ncbi:uncharacterized protein LOC114530602 isoform X2 [Dendronephthya gigantea]|nr:uncharacterized protein LOC114530602 isoform X2 [Dendronephthya gigantea]
MPEGGLGYEMLHEQSIPLHSLLVSQQDSSSFQMEQIRYQNENENVQLSIQYARNQFFLALLNSSNKIYKVFDVDRENVPMFVYDLNELTREVLLTDRLLFTVCGNEEQTHINILSSQLAETGLPGTNAKTKASSCIQAFTLPPGETVLAIYRLTTYAILAKTKHAVHPQSHPVDGCLVITTAAVYEIRPRVSPEELFIELAVNNVDTVAADRLAIITGLDVNTLYEQAGDIAMDAGQLQHALELYQASKSRHSRRVKKFAQHAGMADVITYIQEILEKPADVSSGDRKQLANMAMKCFVQQILAKDSDDSEEMVKLREKFCQFINDNFDYDEYSALDLLASFGLEEYLFQVAKARGLVKQGLEVLAEKGHFHLKKSTQEFLIAKGFADIVCQSCNGAFLRCMSPEDAIQLLLAKPESILPHLNYVKSLLPVLNESTLLRIARLFDPSRPAAKTLLMKFSNTPRRQRVHSGASLTSLDSYLSFTRETNSSAISDLLELFLATLVVLNSKRHFNTFPDLLLIADNCEEKTKSKQLEESILRGGVLPEYVTLSCGQEHSALVTDTGDVYTWGKSCNGRLGHGDLIEEEGKSAPFRVELLHIQKIKVRSVACGREHTLALTKQGVYAWGSSDYGQLGLGNTNKQTRPVFVTELADKDCIALTCGYYHSLALSADRGVWSWGWGVHGQLGFGNVEDYLVPVRVSSLDRCSVIRLAAGYSHTAILTSEGKVYTFGGGVFGQLGLGPVKKQSKPKLVEGIAHEKVQLLCCGSFETMVVTLDRKFYKWGRNAQLIRQAKDYFQKMDNRNVQRKELTHQLVPVEVQMKIFSPIVQICCGNNHAIFLTESGNVYTMGQNDHGQLGLGNKTERTSPVLVQELLTHEVISVGAGAAHCVTVTAQGQTFVWGRGDSGQLGLEIPKLKDITIPTSLKNIPISKLSDKWNNSAESLEDSKLGELEFEKDLSELSSIGTIPYSRESLATALYQLWGFYNDGDILRHCNDSNDTFSSSVIYKIQENWAIFLSYRLKSLSNWFGTMKARGLVKTDVLNELEKLTVTVIADAVRNLSNTCSEDYFPIQQAVLLVNEILRFWKDDIFDQSVLESLLDSHMDFLACPISLLVLRDNSIRERQCNKAIGEKDENRYSYLRREFSPGFLFRVTEATVEQLRTECPRRNIFSKDLDLLLTTRTMGSTPPRYTSFMPQEPPDTSEVALQEQNRKSGKITQEKLWQEIIDNFKRNLEKMTTISLSSTAGSTLVAASLNLEQQSEATRVPRGSVVVFTCEHSFASAHFMDLILPEFEQRMSELPKALPQLTEHLVLKYHQRSELYPTSCPVCVYNFIREDQIKDKKFSAKGKPPQPWDI